MASNRGALGSSFAHSFLKLSLGSEGLGIAGEVTVVHHMAGVGLKAFAVPVFVAAGVELPVQA